MIDSSAEQLSDATKQTAEVILRVGELRNSFEHLISHLHASATTLVNSNKEATSSLSTQIVELNERGEKVHDSVDELRSALESLAADLQRRAAAELAHLDVIKGHAEVSGRALLSITDVARQSSDALKTLPDKVHGISGFLVEGVRQGVSSELERLSERLAKTIDSVVALVERSGQYVTNTIHDEKPSNDNGSVTISVELTKALRDAAAELRRASEESRKITEFVQRISLTMGSKEVSTRKKADGFFAWLRR